MKLTALLFTLFVSGADAAAAYTAEVAGNGCKDPSTGNAGTPCLTPG